MSMSQSPLPPSTRRGVLTPRRVAAAVLVVLAAVLLAQNAASTKVTVFLWSFRAPLWVWLLVAGLVGAAVLALLRRRARRR